MNDKATRANKCRTPVLRKSVKWTVAKSVKIAAPTHNTRPCWTHGAGSTVGHHRAPPRKTHRSQTIARSTRPNPNIKCLSSIQWNWWHAYPLRNPCQTVATVLIPQRPARLWNKLNTVAAGRNLTSHRLLSYSKRTLHRLSLLKSCQKSFMHLAHLRMATLPTLHCHGRQAQNPDCALPQQTQTPHKTWNWNIQKPQTVSAQFHAVILLT